MNRAKLPTILGVIILVIGVVAGVFLINSKSVFKIGASVAATPKNVRFSNVTNTEATVTWNTDIETKGFVKWGKSQNSLSKVALETNSEKSFVHSATISGIDAGSSIFFKVNSEGKDYDNDGIAWQLTTNDTKVTRTENLIASGIVYLADGATPAQAIVTININGTLLTNITSPEGSYIVPISNYIDNISESTAIEITVNGGSNGNSSAVIYSKNIKSIPVIVLGKTYDFRTLTQNNDTTLPESSLSVPQAIEASSRFEITKSEVPNTVSTLSIESIDEGEIINTTDPEFFGKAPTKAQVEIQVESELQSAVITADSKGAWKWSPPNNLEPGEHKVTLKWRDATGILRTVTKSFVVSAAEGPAFESTPSATPTQKATSTATAKATATSTSTQSATPKVTITPVGTLAPTPATGSLAPTIGLFLMGIGVLFSSIIIYRKNNVY